MVTHPGRGWTSAAGGGGGFPTQTHERSECVPGIGERCQRAARAALNPLQEHRTLQAGFSHLFSYPNATPGQTENAFETLTYPDLFPEAQVVLLAEDTDLWWKGGGGRSVTLSFERTIRLR